MTEDTLTETPKARRAAVPGLTIVAGLRVLFGAVGLLGVVFLTVSTYTTVVQIRVLTTTDLAGQDTTVSGSDLHGIALILVAVFALVMLPGALRGAKPAAIALAAAGLLALGLIVGLDVPELDNTGQVAEFYEDVSAGSASGFYFETAGAVMLLLAGGVLFGLSVGREP